MFIKRRKSKFPSTPPGLIRMHVREKMKKKARCIALILFLISVLTNPSMKQFDEFFKTEALYAKVFSYENYGVFTVPIIKGRLYHLLIESWNVRKMIPVFNLVCSYERLQRTTSCPNRFTVRSNIIRSNGSGHNERFSIMYDERLE